MVCNNFGICNHLYQLQKPHKVTRSAVFLTSGIKKSKNVAMAAYRVVSVGVFFLQLSCVVCQKCTDAPFKLAFVLLAEQLGIS